MKILAKVKKEEEEQWFLKLNREEIEDIMSCFSFTIRTKDDPEWLEDLVPMLTEFKRRVYNYEK